MGPDLTQARLTVEGLMDDTCTISLDAAGVSDDAMDLATGALVPVGTAQPLYEGPCMLTPTAPGDGTPEATAPSAEPTDAARQRYRLLLPLLDSPAIPAGAVLTVLTSRRDALLVGARFRADSAGQVSTFSIARPVGMVRL